MNENNINESERTEQSSSITKALVSKSYFPWLSIIFSLVCIYILASQLDFNFPFSSDIKSLIFHPTHLKALLASLLLVFLLELFIFNRHQQINQSSFQRLTQQIEQTWKQKNKQQLRANTYSDHTNKLKSFISDKLIEYMDFDEKFIHFKGIASEVRHNGVISYDKINIALNRAIEQQRFLAIYEQKNALNGTQTIDENAQQTESSLYDYQSAKDSINYLWDLLDLSTAENMSLYIGNKLIEYEENYFQTQLNANQHTDTSLTIGYHPTFYPLQALLMSLQLFTDSEETRHLLINGKINSELFNQPFNFENEQFLICTDTTNELLGNPNHIVLLLENLIKNAQFFSNKIRYKQKSDRIVINIASTKLEVDEVYEDDSEPTNDAILFSIYNRGNNIADEELDQIFKLGYTTRRKKDVHGRGLGLYFANEIVKGYQGTIKAININSNKTTYKLILGLASGEIFIYFIQCEKLNERMVCCLLESENSIDNIRNRDENKLNNDLKIEHDIPLKTIQIMNLTSEQIFSIEEIASNNKTIQTWVDNRSVENSLRLPEWEISLNVFKKKQIFTFKALDITGVRFDVNIPSVLE
ncbi:MAG: hypothetical protein COB38_01390 [Gammaproteobacteria bacterium]|nr:MAG: hypothetical protein COB38_01390 [Gammaproteobacteria bacterium]